MLHKIPHSLRFHCQANFEGWAAGIAAAGVAVSAGSAISSGVASSNAADAQADAARAAGKQPKIVAANFEDPGAAYTDYFNQVQTQYPRLADTARTITARDNADYQGELSKTSPNLMAGIAQQGKVSDELLRGVVPSDVAGQVNRSSAYQALMGGYAGSGASHALTARDLGLTSLDLQSRGSAMLGANVTNTKAVNPYSITADSMMLTPQQLLSRSDSNEAYANAVLNRNNNIQYQNGIYAAAANSYNPTGAGVASGIGAVGGVVNNVRNLYGAANSGSPSGGGNYTTQGSNSYDAASAYATQGGYYNPYMDTNNYTEDGTFVGTGYGS